MNYILALDQGTSSTRARLYQTDGDIVFNVQKNFSSSYPQSGWVEQDPEVIWQSTQYVLQKVAEFAHNARIIGCGIANQRETSVMWQKSTGQCLGPALVWQDRRTAKYCHDLADATPMLRSKTGLLLDPYFSASKFHWMLQHYPRAHSLLMKEDLACGTIDTFLLWRLTKGQSFKTDVSNASRTLLFNIHDLNWDDELLNLFAIPRSILPEVCSCDSHFGELSADFFGYPIPVCGIAGDQQAALIGQCVFESGMIKATFGTGAFLLMNTGNKIYASQNQLLSTIAYKIKGQLVYGLEGSIYQAGTMIKWLRDQLKLFTHADDCELLANSVTSNEGMYFIPSFTGLGAPWWNNKAGAIIQGISFNCNAAHFARAALEAVAYQTQDVLLAMQKDTGFSQMSMRVDGGMVVNNWLLQRLANQSNLQVERPVDIETTVRGAAMIAAVGCGLYSSLDALKNTWQSDASFFPQPEELHNARNDYQGWLDAVKGYLG